MRTHIATLETGTGVKVRLSKTDSGFSVDRFSRANNQWVPWEVFEDLDSAVNAVDDQIYECAGAFIPKIGDEK